MSLPHLLAEAFWQEAESFLAKAELDPRSEVQLFGYFPALRLSSLFGSTFLEGKTPVNLLVLGPSFLLLEDELPADKVFYTYLVVRERMTGGIRLSYLLPYCDWTGDVELELLEVEFSSVESRAKVLDIESKIPGYAGRWLEGEDEETV